MNVLLTSAGRRIGLIKCFKDVVHKSGGKIFAGDIDGLAPALFFADFPKKLPRVSDKGYIPQLLELVKNDGIKLIVPTIDYDLPVLASWQGEFIKSNFGNKGFAVPRSWLPDQINMKKLPNYLFVKPRNGSASQNTFSVGKQDLAQILSFVPKPIVQENIKAKEITVDALLDFSGRLIHYVPRLRIRLGGESIQGVTISDHQIRDWLIEILVEIGKLGGRGPITIQAFLTEGGPVLSEINPRFGGGIPLTFAAGGNYPAWIMEMVAGREVSPKPGEYKVGLYMTRHYVEIFSEGPFFL